MHMECPADFPSHQEHAPLNQPNTSGSQRDMMSEIRPEPAPQVSLPSSPSTVRVRAIDTTTRMVVDASAFVQPGIKNHEKLNFKTMCFLVEHDGSSGPEHVLFDCGSRKDFWNGSPQAQGMIGDHVPDVQVEHGVDEILAMGGFSLEDLSKWPVDLRIPRVCCDVC